MAVILDEIDLIFRKMPGRACSWNNKAASHYCPAHHIFFIGIYDDLAAPVYISAKLAYNAEHEL